MKEFKMAAVKYQPVTPDHNAFLDKAKKREEFKKAYKDLAEEYVFGITRLP
jgi:ssDNA-specific exonuclease RecJ